MSKYSVSEAMDVIQKVYESMTEDYEDLEHENIKLKEEVEEKDNLIEELREELKGVYDQLEDANKQIDKLEEEIFDLYQKQTG